MNNYIFENLKTKYLGKKIVHLEKIDSTQKEVWRRLNNNNIENGTIIISDIQTDGVGTHGRTWYTTEKNNIAFSFFINLNCNINLLHGFTIEVAEIFIKIFETLYNIKIDIKNPNDLTVNEKKIGGILVESKCVGNIVKYIVIGIGINTNQKKFPNEIKNIATSIKNEFNIEIDNTKVLETFCNLLEEKLIRILGVV